jgi:flagellar motor switch protein FliM
VNQILSQDEVDALLKGLDSGEIETEKGTSAVEPECHPFDWATQGRHLKGNLPVLGMIYERFAQKFRHALSGYLRRMVEVAPGPIEMIKFEEFQRSLPVPTGFHQFKIDPLRGAGMLVIEGRLVFNLVEAFFGGLGTGSVKVEGRDFTPIEKKIIDKVVSTALTHIREAWEGVYPIRTQWVRSESNPQSVKAVQPSEYLLTVRFEITLNQSAGSVMICLPYASLQPIRDQLSGGTREEEETDTFWISTLEKQLQETEVELTVDLGCAPLSIQEFLNMKAGDILILDKNPRSPLTAKVEGIPRLEGHAGKFGNKRVFRVESAIAPRA